MNWTFKTRFKANYYVIELYTRRTYKWQFIKDERDRSSNHSSFTENRWQNISQDTTVSPFDIIFLPLLLRIQNQSRDIRSRLCHEVRVAKIESNFRSEEDTPFLACSSLRFHQGWAMHIALGVSQMRITVHRNCHIFSPIASTNIRERARDGRPTRWLVADWQRGTALATEAGRGRPEMAEDRPRRARAYHVRRSTVARLVRSSHVIQMHHVRMYRKRSQGVCMHSNLVNKFPEDSVIFVQNSR